MPGERKVKIGCSVEELITGGEEHEARYCLEMMIKMYPIENILFSDKFRELCSKVDPSWLMQCAYENGVDEKSMRELGGHSNLTMKIRENLFLIEKDASHEETVSQQLSSYLPMITYDDLSRFEQQVLMRIPWYHPTFVKIRNRHPIFYSFLESK